MPIEAILTRELEIRFIDARELANEAKICLGFHGYPTKDQEKSIRREAIRLFNARPVHRKRAMRRQSHDLQRIKSFGKEATISCASSLHSSDEFSGDDVDHGSNNNVRTTNDCRRKQGWFRGLR